MQPNTVNVIMAPVRTRSSPPALDRQRALRASAQANRVLTERCKETRSAGLSKQHPSTPVLPHCPMQNVTTYRSKRGFFSARNCSGHAILAKTRNSTFAGLLSQNVRNKRRRGPSRSFRRAHIRSNGMCLMFKQKDLSNDSHMFEK